jgi:acyl CoA:acetate/3-ketoacid CoA transferase alpha subunit
MDKTLPLDQLSSLVEPGATLALGGAWLSNHPLAAVRQMIRDGVEDLHLVSSLASIEVDLLVAAGAVRTLTFSMVSLEAYGLAPNFRRAAESGEIELREVSGVALNVAFDAGAHRLPFLPMRGIGGSELPLHREDFYRAFDCPFTGRRLLGIRAIEPDVAIVHATRADREGNAQVDASWSNDPEIARAARRVVVTCEEIVDTEVLARNPTSTHIPGFLVDAVVEAPLGAHPTSHIPLYVTDGKWLLDYVDACAEDGIDAVLAAIRGEDEEGYRGRVLDLERRRVLAALAQGRPPLEVGGR